MTPLIDFNLAAKQFLSHGRNALYKMEWKMDDAAATSGLWVQVHDSISTPAEGSVPRKSWPAAQSQEGFKDFKEKELWLSLGLYVCVSTTEATKTLATGSNKFSMVAVEVLRPDHPTGTTIAGDYTTNRQTLNVWVVGPHRLVSLEVDGTAGSASYIMVFPNNASNGARPILSVPIAAGEAKIGSSGLSFGDDGIDIQSRSDPNTTINACVVKISTTAEVLTTTAENFKIRAEYL